jgi:Fe2+ or Zn2+ uptake regulation protein
MITTGTINVPVRFDWAIEQLRKAHVRVTPVREKVLGLLAARAVPSTLHEISASRELEQQFDDATVYRTLVLLVELEVARQFQFRDRATCFLLNMPGESFSYLLCRCCGAITRIPDPNDVCTLEKQVISLHGYLGVTHQLELHGVCPECQEHTSTCKPSKLLPGLRLRGRTAN